MLDIQIGVKDPPSVRLRPIASSLTGSAQSYSSVAVDEIELASDYGASTDQRHTSTRSRREYAPNSLIAEASWIHRDFWTDSWNDVKKFPLAWLARRFLSHFLPLVVIVLVGYLVGSMSMQSGVLIVDYGNVCSPDGQFELSFNDYNPWNRNATFSIDVNFGSFSFGVAKLLDICWDVGAARGGQGLLAFYSYLAFTKALSRTMENSDVSHGTFSAITLQHNTISSLLILARDFFKTSGLRAKLVMAWIIFAASFVLFSSTWLSAMTGYTADIVPYVLDNQNTFVPVGNFKPVIYTIVDASRFDNGFKDNHHITAPWVDATEPYLTPGYGCGYLFYEDYSPGEGSINFTASDYPSYHPGVEDLDCKWMWAVSKYVYDWGFLATSNKRNTTFERPGGSNVTTTILFDPPLNITTNPTTDTNYESDYLGYWWYYPYGPTWQDPDTKQYPYNQSNPAFWYNSSQTLYDLAELNNQGSCLQEGSVTYKWGFSFVLLFTFAIVFLIWCIGTWILYLDSWLHSGLDLSRRHMGPERAVLDMARSMEPKLAIDEVEFQSNSQIKSLVQGSTITYSDLSPRTTRWHEFKWWWRDFKFRRWVKNEKWWLYALLLFTILFILGLSTPMIAGWSPLFSTFPGFGILVVLAVGRDVRSRWLLFTFFFLLFGALNFWWIAEYRRCGWLCE